MRRPSAALVLSSAALFVALGGPAAAQRAALEVVARLLATGTRPAPLIMHAATSYTPVDALRPTA